MNKTKKEIAKYRHKQYLNHRSEYLERRKKYQKEHRAERLKYLEEYNAKNRNKIRKYKKEYAKKNKIKIRARRKIYYKKNQARLSTQKKKHYKKYRLEILKRIKKSYKKNIIKRKKYLKKYYLKHRDKLRKASRQNNNKYHILHKKEKSLYSKIHRTTVKLETMKKYGGKCVSCGDTDLAALTIDHINNDGMDERKHEGNSGHMFYCKLLRNPIRKDLQVLCHSCQWRKCAYGNDISLWLKRAILINKNPYRAINKFTKWVNTVEYKNKLKQNYKIKNRMIK